jgi:hypothetical protein
MPTFVSALITSLSSYCDAAAHGPSKLGRSNIKSLFTNKPSIDHGSGPLSASSRPDCLDYGPAGRRRWRLCSYAP